MRASISTDATRPLDIKMLLKRFDVYVSRLYQCIIAYQHSCIALSQKPARTFYTTPAVAVVGI
jgi:hypothetical protein